MDKKPTIAILKNEIDKLKSSFETEKDEKDIKINHILSVVEGLSKSLSLYIEDNDKETTNEEVNITEIDEINKNIVKNLEDKVNCLEQDVQYLKNELKKKDADWQQKLDLIVHQFTKQYDSLKSLLSVSQKETSVSQSVQNPIQKNVISPLSPILQIKFAALTEYAQKPKIGSEFSVGIDLRSAYEYLVPANGNKLIKTDWKIQYPDGYFGKICSRSGLSLNHNIEVGAGIIDPDWRDGVSVVLNNLSPRDFHVAPGDRIAQLICTPYITPEIVFCKPNDIPDTVRGTNGFGSTGIN